MSSVISQSEHQLVSVIILDILSIALFPDQVHTFTARVKPPRLSKNQTGAGIVSWKVCEFSLQVLFVVHVNTKICTRLQRVDL